MYYVRKVAGDKRIMKPRIFVSSTFYDLKYAREDIASFIKAHDFEPIMFEDSDIGYTPGKPLDDSCYEAMRNADMVVLIIGGKYGSPATGEKADSFKEFISVTRREFETAITSGIPVYCFIESKVYTEFALYEANEKKINDNPNEITFVTTKSLNVFKFIKEIKMVGNIPITEFNKTNQIKEFLGKQWSDMFKQYLKILREDKEIVKLGSTVTDMQNLIKGMEVMLNSVGKKVLSDENDGYEHVLRKQKIMRVIQFINHSFGLKPILDLDECVDESRFYKDIVSALTEIVDNEALIKPEQDPDITFADYKRLQDIFSKHSIILHQYVTSNEKEYKQFLRDFKEVDPGELAEKLQELYLHQ